MFGLYSKSLICVTAIFWLLLSCQGTPDVTKVQDTIPPVLSITKQTDTIFLGETWTNPSAIATDNIDQNITSQIMVLGKVVTEKPGVYSLIYTVSDQAGNNSCDTMNVYVILDPSTVAWYPFNNNVKDYSSNQFNGTVVGKDSLTADRFGNARSAFNFDGASYINVPYKKELDYSGAFTISVWGKSDVPITYYAATSGKDAFILNMGFGAERDYGIYLNPDQGISFRYNLTIINFSTVIIEQWHHYAMVFTGDSLKGYVDGNLVGSKKTGVGVIDDNPFRIGCESKNATRFWKGNVDDVLMLKVGYNDSHIKALAEIGSFIPDTTHSDTTHSDTTHSDTTHSDTTHSDTSTTISNLKTAITGSSGSLTLKLTWDEVPSAFSYAVYYNTGKNVTTNDYYRVAASNSKTFTTELTEGEEYSFAVAFVIGGVESALSKPVTVIFKL